MMIMIIMIIMINNDNDDNDHNNDNNNDNNDNDDNDHNNEYFILKISGIWENKDNIGITFKIINIKNIIKI